MSPTISRHRPGRSPGSPGDTSSRTSGPQRSGPQRSRPQRSGKQRSGPQPSGKQPSGPRRSGKQRSGSQPSPGGRRSTAEDPRIADRREQVELAVRRRTRRVLLAGAGAVGVAALAVGVIRSPLLDVDSVVVTGSDAVDHAEVARASGIRRGDAMVDVDATSARAAAMALPMVASARVEREWPGRVRIKVVGEVPLVTVEAAGSTWVVARGGRVVGHLGPGDGDSGSNAAGLPPVSVADGLLADGTDSLEVGRDVPRELAGVVVAAEQMSTSLIDRLSGIEVAQDATVTLALADDGGRIAFGRAEDVPAKLLAIDSVLAGVDLHCMGILDVREPSRPTVSRREGCRANPPTVGEPAAVGTKGSTGGGG